MSANRLKITFSKQEPVKYISHLDFVRVWQRAFKRAGIPVSYSQGFNPHPVMSFLMPLSVGFTSECEELTIELDEKMDTGEIERRLFKTLPHGIAVTESGYMAEDEKRARISKARYRVFCEIQGQNTFDADAFMANSQIVIEKKTKSGVKETNIKPDIFDFSVIENTKDTICFETELACGDIKNLNPKVVVSAIEKYFPGISVAYVKIHRIKME